MERIERMYEELVETVKELRPYYNIDKIKTYSVYVWDKVSHTNVFDIQKDRIIFYEEHEIIQEAIPIINNIQLKLQYLDLERN